MSMNEIPITVWNDPQGRTVVPGAVLNGVYFESASYRTHYLHKDQGVTKDLSVLAQIKNAGAQFTVIYWTDIRQHPYWVATLDQWDQFGREPSIPQKSPRRILHAEHWTKVDTLTEVEAIVGWSGCR